jgi:hypothetical protein
MAKADPKSKISALANPSSLFEPQEPFLDTEEVPKNVTPVIPRRIRRNNRHGPQSVVFKVVKSCDWKVHYNHFCRAIRDADRVMEEVTLLFDPMTVYRCGKHGGFHKGHNRFMNPNAVEVYATAARDRERGRSTTSLQS